MNKRQRKKLARIKNDWYTDKYKGEYNCPVCNWNTLNDEEFKHQYIVDKWYNWSSYGYDFTIHAKCPDCGCEFEYTDGDK